METMPSPPGRLSITTGCAQRRDSASASVRATASVPAPGAASVMKRTVRVGQAASAPAWARRRGMESAAPRAVPSAAARNVRRCGTGSASDNERAAIGFMSSSLGSVMV